MLAQYLRITAATVEIQRLMQFGCRMYMLKRASYLRVKSHVQKKPAHCTSKESLAILAQELHGRHASASVGLTHKVAAQYTCSVERSIRCKLK
jgi:hypothetical protein